MRGVGDTRYVPWAEGCNGRTVSQVTVFGDWDEELDPGDWSVVSQGSNGEGGKGEEGEEEEAGEKGGHQRVLGELLFRTREEAHIHLRASAEEGEYRDDGDDGDDEEDGADDKVEWGDKGGEDKGDKGGKKEGETGAEKGGTGSKDTPRQTPPHTGGVACMSRLVKGGMGGRGSDRANPPLSDAAPARQVTFQVTYGVGWGANRATREMGGGGGEPNFP